MFFIPSNNLLNKFQCGFRKNHGAHTALTKLTNDIRKGMNIQQITLLVMFDFSKAFDKVSHSLLLSLLSKIGLSESTERWFRSYLVDRKHRVRYPLGEQSEWKSVTSGVEGSVLGPLLFILFINNITLRY